MPRETGFGSPPDDPDGAETGFGAPVDPDAPDGESGYGEPLIYTSADSLGMTLRRAFTGTAENERRGFDPAYAEDGGEIVEVKAAWPISGPYMVKLRDMAGTLYPDGSYARSGVPEQWDQLYANASRDYLRFALPKLPRGVYDLLFAWEGVEIVKEKALRIVARRPRYHTAALLREIGTSTRLERLPSEVLTAQADGGGEIVG